MQDHQEMLEKIPAYTLGALDPAEAEMLASHIASCFECQTELQLFQQATEQIGLAAAGPAPSAEIKERLFSQISPEPEVSKEPSGWQRWFSRRPALALVSLGLVLVLAVSNLLLWNQVQRFRLPSFRVVNLAATEAMPNADGMLVISADGKYGTLVASDLASLPEDQQYQLWLIKGEERTSGGVFSVAGSGYVAFQVYSKQPLESFDGVGITIEPYGGSPGPTGDRVMGADL